MDMKLLVFSKPFKTDSSFECLEHKHSSLGIVYDSVIANIRDIQVTNNNIFENCENRECNCTAENMDYGIPVLDRRSTAEKESGK